MRNMIIFVVAGLMIAGCKNSSTDLINPTNEINESTKTTDEALSETDIVFQDVEPFKSIEASDCVFVGKTDCQSNVGELQEMAYTENGYYYKKDCFIAGTCGGEQLRFYDYETGLDIEVCSRLECDHENVDCDAYLSRDVYTHCSRIWYQNNYIYVPRYYEDYVAIERITSDGTEREISCKLMRSNIKITENDDGSITSAENLPQIWLHRGYAYFCTYAPGVNPVGLYRVRLDSNDEAELICQIDKQGEGYVMMYRVKPYGRYVMFQMGEYADTDDYTLGIYAYDTENGSIISVCENAIRDYMVHGEFLYYFDLNDNIYRMNLETGKSVLFYENSHADDSFTKLFSSENNIIFEKSGLGKTDSTGKKIEYTLQIVINQKGETIYKLDSSEDKILTEYSVDILTKDN